jgi:squalene-hopene/tetraprenyl-beta-curcumene cyclase
LKVLEAIQPVNGGFLEATPLTSFVTMSLAGSDLGEHPVTRRGVDFLKSSQRADGSWPIDTNLATWLTTLSVNALGNTAAGSALSWLLRQQHLKEHPYTHAAPGGWAWTDLPGGVPDADDTAGAILGLRTLAPDLAQAHSAAIAGVEWLLRLQNSDGGIPTFCRGWGALPFDQSSADITAHALRAWKAWRATLPTPLQSRIDGATASALRFLKNIQRADGSWIPLWFGNEHAPNEENAIYGTSRVLLALSEFPKECASEITRGVAWLQRAESREGGWGGAPGTPVSIEETALALEALAKTGALRASSAEWLIAQVESGKWKSPSPIGFYFAKLWYYEDLYPQIFTTGALREIVSSLR